MPSLENVIIQISVGRNGSMSRVAAKKKTWKSFKAMFDRSKVLVDTSCSFAQYDAMGETKEGRDKQGVKKMAAGNWSPALFKDGRRKMPNMLEKTGVVFDLDYVSADQLDGIRDCLVPISQYAWFMHTTRSHCPERPRVRMFVPVSRSITLEEANALTRLLACELSDDPDEGIEIPDIVSMKSNQVMYLPSISRDQEYWTDENPGAVLDVDEFLAEHPHWSDHALLPYQEKEKNRGGYEPDRKMEDPREKRGIIGAWCRTYDVEESIAEFLTDSYAPGDDGGSDTRYSYLGGGTSNGAVVYDGGQILFSNHGSDPIEGAANSWDLVRIHKFGHLDADSPANTLLSNLPSSKQMQAFARADDMVKDEMLKSVIPQDWDEEDDEEPEEDKTPKKPKAADRSIADLMGEDDDDDDEDTGGWDAAPDEDEEPEEKPKEDWRTSLTLDKQENLEKSLHNCATIIKNNKRVAPCIALNDLDGGPYLRKVLRFPKANLAQAAVLDETEGRRWTDNDTAALMCALAAPRKMDGYGTQFTRQDVELSLLQAAEKNRYNPFLDKVKAVKWDGVPRLGTFFRDWFRTADNEYHGELGTSWFIAGIARQYEPGHLYDLVPILGGRQGGGKTGAIRELGMGHNGSLSGDYSDTQKMAESTKGKVVLEVAELKGLSTGMIEDVKHYFTADKDTVRLAYRRNEEDFYRRCVYMGTTNQSHYLRDEENRRFCPVLTDTSDANKVDFANFIPAVPQFWAEAHHRYHEMRKAQPFGVLPLHFTSKAAKVEALRLQTESRETMPYEPVAEVIEQWLNEPMTAEMVEVASDTHRVDWDTEGEDAARYVRNLVTVTIIRVALKDNPIIRDLRGAHADKTIGQALKSLPGWDALGYVHRCGRKRRWYARDTASGQEFVLRGNGGPSVDDLLA